MFRNEQYTRLFPNNKRRILSFCFIGLLLMSVLLVVSTVNEPTQVNWTSWITGQSLSSDFHYLDLVELLFRLGQ